MIILSCNHISKAFGIDTILNNISFSINKGEKIGLVGTNGAGKSTLFKIITGKHSYDSGELYLSKNISIGYLEQHTDLSNQNSIFDEILQVFEDLIKLEAELRNLEQDISATSSDSKLQILMDTYALKSEEFQKKNGYGYSSEIKGVLRGLGFNEDEFHKPIYQLSGGQKTRVRLGKLLLRKPDILLLDEPTNHLDMDATEWLESFLKSYNGTILLISHDRYFLDQVVEKMYEIENKELITYNGNYTYYTQKKEVLFHQRQKEYLAQQKEVEKQEEIIRRFKQHGTEKLAKRARSREKKVDSIERIEKPLQFQKNTKIRFETQIKSGNDILKANNLSKSFDIHLLFKNVNFEIYKGEKIGLIGPNGIGKSTLLKMILENISYDTGSIVLGHNVEVGYFDQEQSELNLKNTVIDEIWHEHIHFTQTQVRTLLGSFLFIDEEVFKEISALSGGEKSKLSLLKLMLSKSNFLLMDEPTNHLDIVSKEVLEEALTNYDGTILVISHDRYFLNKVTNKTFDLSPDGLETYLGNYAYYQEKKNMFEETKPLPIESTQTKTQVKDARRKEKEKQLQERKSKKQLQELEQKIASLEEQMNDLQDLMCKEEIYSNPEKSKEINTQSATLKQDLDILYEQWENFSDDSL
ncbi:ABC-F type ribosomal protection protein [Lutibacter sp. B2]|nr:ABC-F type ribosomal protection protein [Lutibacter sp. B2]